MGEGVPLADIGQVPPQFKSNLDAAHAAMRLTPQERALYERHVSNLFGPGGVDNPDGSRSTLYQLSFESGGKTYNVPTVYDGKILKPDAAIDAAFAQGLNNFPSYPDQAAAEKRYQQMHGFMEGDTAAYLARRPNAGSNNGTPLSQLGSNIDQMIAAAPNLANNSTLDFMSRFAKGR